MEQTALAGSPRSEHSVELVHPLQVSSLEHIGVAAGHSPLTVHWTHLFVVLSHTGLAPEQVELSVHCTHCPSLRHTG